MGWNERRESFGELAEAYDSYRPDWPPATAAWLTGTDADGPLVDRAETEAGLDVLDLGAGTGKLTRRLVQAGHRVTAVDPSEGMLAVLSAALPQVTAIEASAEAIPLADRSLDAITIAQAWHWLDQPVAAAECARLLRPGGVLAIGWHLRRATEPWVQELNELTGEPEYANGGTVRGFTGPVELPDSFEALQSATFDYSLALTPQSLAALASSWSYVATRPDRDQVLVEIEALGRRVADPDGVVALPHLTRCYRAVRRPDAG